MVAAVFGVSSPSLDEAFYATRKRGCQQHQLPLKMWGNQYNRKNKQEVTYEVLSTKNGFRRS